MYQDYYGETNRSQGMQRYVTRTYLTMTLGLVLTFVTSLLTAVFAPSLGLDFRVAMVLLVLQVIVAISMGGMIAKARYGTVVGMFILYSLLTGISLSYIFVFYDIGRIFLCFLAAATAFAVMALMGFVTKRDLSVFSRVFFGGLIGLLLLGIVGLFLQNAWLDIGICMLGLVLFLGITAFDSQKLKEYYRHFGESEEGKKIGVYAALQLYLDFINIFLYMVRLFGRSRD